jgi:hypothetical protein
MGAFTIPSLPFFSKEGHLASSITLSPFLGGMALHNDVTTRYKASDLKWIIDPIASFRISGEARKVLIKSRCTNAEPSLSAIASTSKKTTFMILSLGEHLSSARVSFPDPYLIVVRLFAFGRALSIAQHDCPNSDARRL